MKHILMIATGGTIASRETADGLTPQLTSGELLAEVPELEQLCRIDTVQLMNRDSTNINSRDWLQIAKSNEARGKIRQWFKKEKREENIARARAGKSSRTAARMRRRVRLRT